MAGYLEATGPITTAAFDENTAAIHAAVAAPVVTTRKPRLLAAHLTAGGAVTVTILAGAVALYGPVTLASGGKIDLQPAAWGWGDGAAGAAINVQLSAGVQVVGAIAVQHIDQ